MFFKVSPFSVPDGSWERFAYASCFNVLNLFVCLFGSKIFGRTSALILAIVFACSLVTGGSFFADTVTELINVAWKLGMDGLT